jgi:hypothetical protein
MEAAEKMQRETEIEDQPGGAAGAAVEGIASAAKHTRHKGAGGFGRKGSTAALGERETSGKSGIITIAKKGISNLFGAKKKSKKTHDKFTEVPWSEMSNERRLKKIYARPELLKMKHIDVLWEDGWYRGTVTQYNSYTKEHTVEYDDGELRRFKHTRKRWKFACEKDGCKIRCTCKDDQDHD